MPISTASLVALEIALGRGGPAGVGAVAGTAQALNNRSRETSVPRRVRLSMGSSFREGLRLHICTYTPRAARRFPLHGIAESDSAILIASSRGNSVSKR